MEKRSKRMNGEGNWWHDDRENLWTLKFSYKNALGKSQRRKVSAKTKALAILKRDKILAEVAANIQNIQAVSVKEWVKRWLDMYKKVQVRPRTYEKYTTTLNRYFVDYFGERKLMDITTKELQNHFNSLLVNGGKKHDGLSSSTVRALRTYLSDCYESAIDSEVVMNNPVKKTKSPKIQTNEITILSEKQITELIKTAGKADNPFEKHVLCEIIRLDINTGLREGEIFGLRWEDVDFKAKCITIRRSLVHVKGEGALFQEPKTKRSIRNIAISDHDVKCLSEYKSWQNVYAQELGDLFAWDGQLVFTTAFGRPICPSNFIKRYFRPLLQKCNIDDRIIFHDLRHMHATMLLKAGVHPKIVQERLGHSSIKVTMDTYSHVIPTMQSQAVEALGDMAFNQDNFEV